MNLPIITRRILPLFILIGLILIGPLFFPHDALSVNDLLKELIIAENRATLDSSLTDGTYRGEEGILRIRPEIGKSLGMTVFMDQDYLDSRDLFEKADKSLEEAESAMASKKKENFSGEHVRRVADQFLAYKKATGLAKKKLTDYRPRLNRNVDERLKKDVSLRIMEKLLSEKLKKTENRLRDALGLFYNTCQGVNQNENPLTDENVTFVNKVVYQFTRQAPQAVLKKFDLDRESIPHDRASDINWEQVVGKRGARYVLLLQKTIKNNAHKGYAVDPLLFLALMRRESGFNPLAVSSVGAVGLTQIMPKTGKGLGMKKIYEPKYLYQALSMVRDEQKKRRQAKTALFLIDEKNGLKEARKARALIQTSLMIGEKRQKLFSRYKKELKAKRNDDRLKPALAIEHGYRYFARQLKKQKGDISLALASYNAGPHRVQKYKGIPPFKETVLFRNRVLQYYQGYLEKLGGVP